MKLINKKLKSLEENINDTDLIKAAKTRWKYRSIIEAKFMEKLISENSEKSI